METRAIAVASVAVFVVMMSCLSSVRSVSVEQFTVFDQAKLLQQLKAQQGDGLKDAWTQAHADVFESFMKVNGMAPTDVVIKHYLYVRNRQRLSKKALEERMRSDQPSEAE